MNSGDVITFNAKKNFTYIKPLGNGGTGDTHLFKDETTDMLFAIKKYNLDSAALLWVYMEWKGQN